MFWNFMIYTLDDLPKPYSSEKLPVTNLIPPKVFHLFWIFWLFVASD